MGAIRKYNIPVADFAIINGSDIDSHMFSAGEATQAYVQVLFF